VIGNIRAYREIIPAYNRMDDWNRKAQTLLLEHISSSRPAVPELIYWIGFPLYGEEVLSAPMCLTEFVNLYYGREVYEDFIFPVYRLARFKGFISNPEVGPPDRRDLIVYDDGLKMEIISYQQALNVLRELKPELKSVLDK
jgi:hypothetical protein